MRILGLILARKGSKGIPGKNLKDLGGFSLVGRCVREAVRSKLDAVYVWSDCADIRSESEKYGAVAPKRPLEKSGDTITTEETVNAFMAVESNFEALCVLQCTTPFLKTRHIDQALNTFREKKWDSVVSCTEFGRFLGYPAHDDRSEFIPFRPYRALRQENTPKIYMENGGIYLALKKIWNSGRRIGRRCGVVVMDWWESIEIDEPLDLEVARKIGDIFFDNEVETKTKGCLEWIRH